MKRSIKTIVSDQFSHHPENLEKTSEEISHSIRQKISSALDQRKQILSFKEPTGHRSLEDKEIYENTSKLYKFLHLYAPKHTIKDANIQTEIRDLVSATKDAEEDIPSQTVLDLIPNLRLKEQPTLKQSVHNNTNINVEQTVKQPGVTQPEKKSDSTYNYTPIHFPAKNNIDCIGNFWGEEKINVDVEENTPYDDMSFGPYRITPMDVHQLQETKNYFEFRTTSATVLQMDDHDILILEKEKSMDIDKLDTQVAGHEESSNPDANQSSSASSQTSTSTHIEKLTKTLSSKLTYKHSLTATNLPNNIYQDSKKMKYNTTPIIHPHNFTNVPKGPRAFLEHNPTNRYNKSCNNYLSKTPQNILPLNKKNLSVSDANSIPILKKKREMDPNISNDEKGTHKLVKHTERKSEYECDKNDNLIPHSQTSEENIDRRFHSVQNVIKRNEKSNFIEKASINVSKKEGKVTETSFSSRLKKVEKKEFQAPLEEMKELVKEEVIKGRKDAKRATMKNQNLSLQDVLENINSTIANSTTKFPKPQKRIITNKSTPEPERTLIVIQNKPNKNILTANNHPVINSRPESTDQNLKSRSNSITPMAAQKIHKTKTSSTSPEKRKSTDNIHNDKSKKQKVGSISLEQRIGISLKSEDNNDDNNNKKYMKNNNIYRKNNNNNNNNHRKYKKKNNKNYAKR